MTECLQEGGQGAFHPPSCDSGMGAPVEDENFAAVSYGCRSGKGGPQPVPSSSRFSSGSAKRRQQPRAGGVQGQRDSSRRTPPHQQKGAGASAFPHQSPSASFSQDGASPAKKQRRTGGGKRPAPFSKSPQHQNRMMTRGPIEFSPPSVESLAALSRQQEMEREDFLAPPSPALSQGKPAAAVAGSIAGSCDSAAAASSRVSSSPVSTGVTLEMQTLLILDWDDTLMPTSWLRDEVAPSLGISGFQALAQRVDEEAQQGWDVLHPEHRRALDQLDFAVRNLILGLVRKVDNARVVLVTNASGDWVAESGSRYLPRTHHTLQRLNTRVVYAREQCAGWGQSAEGRTMNLKIPAFFEEMRQFHGMCLRRKSRWDDKEEGGANGYFLNIIGVGDQEGDREALFRAGEMFATAISASGPTRVARKFVRLAESPTASGLLKELRSLQRRFTDESLVLMTDDVDARADVWVKEDNSPRESKRGRGGGAKGTSSSSGRGQRAAPVHLSVFEGPVVEAEEQTETAGEQDEEEVGDDTRTVSASVSSGSSETDALLMETGTTAEADLDEEEDGDRVPVQATDVASLLF
uniref:Uncharacterized protein n=1 Tax=Chromera velia CCMP2878 TaxID=1169474 RepID=A0A0G4FGT8_9ALVE|eukprot:Cvel_16752.t1-p1 / transcript=Cvel_16752.t1 / gene=Cvel_16752 / organism=Chromera_velia_CCMP2878 / gene_product=hypothetical protein / transcript_product=hypothetical protein / location=Cvel_scaffold1305:22125-25012(-) / protein_length=578 / sequence_SO=supercontig / SO=protein_coding / is_pseudo=false